MKKIFGLTIFELLLFLCSMIAIIVCFILGNDKNVLSFIVSLIGVVSVLVMAKGWTFGPIINISSSIIYSVLAIIEHYYGEAIAYLGIIVPIYVFTIISWFRNKNKDNSNVVEVNKIHWKEYLYVLLFSIPLTVGFYFLLRALNTSELVASTISLITNVIGTYLLLRRSSYYAISFIVNDIILIFMWSVTVAQKGVGYLPVVISYCVFLINNTYGLIRWKKQEIAQRKNNNSETQSQPMQE